MDDIFTFDNIADVDDKVLKNSLWKIDKNELSKALIDENAEIRKKVYRNMSLQDLHALNKDMLDTGRFTRFEKKEAQRKILSVIAKTPEYNSKRFENGFETLEDFEDYLTLRKPNDGMYGIFNKDVTMCRLSATKNGEELLADIEQKNKEQGMGNIEIPNTKIKLINYSICPTCGKIYSFKDLSDYYIKPKHDSRFKNNTEQFRLDTRVYCNDCGTYFLPALIISDGTPKNEVQFLCRIQTMHAIESYYSGKNMKVLSNNKVNILTKDLSDETSTVQNTSAVVMRKLFNETPSKITAIRNDVFLKDMEEKPSLITNLIQYTPANIVLNLIDGTNYRKKDVLFGAWG
ncbi:FliG C-terminal domain-containing protein [Treponema sp. R80B11-R83G3]